MDFTNQQRQQAEAVINKIQVHYSPLSKPLNNIISCSQVELEQLQEQIEKRKERLTTLIHQRQELDQISSRLIAWYDDKQRLISSAQSIPLKAPDIERIQKKNSV